MVQTGSAGTPAGAAAGCPHLAVTEAQVSVGPQLGRGYATCVCVRVRVCACMCVGPPGGQKRVSNPLELKPQAAMSRVACVPGIRLRSSGKAPSYWAISLAPVLYNKSIRNPVL